MKFTEGYSPPSEREVARQSRDGRSLRQHRYTKCQRRSNGHAVSLSHLTVTAPSRKEPKVAEQKSPRPTKMSRFRAFFILHFSFFISHKYPHLK